MKKSILILIILVITGCYNKNYDNQDDAANKSTIIDNSVFGQWISIDYLESIRKTKSPYKASEKNPYRILDIRRDYLIGDTLKISWNDASLSEFPGYECYKIITPNTFEYIGYTYDNEKPDLKEYYAGDVPPPLHSLKLENGILSVIDKKNNIIKRYSLLTKDNDKDLYIILNELNEIINKELVEGKYKDMNDQNKTISFLPNGKVDGIENFSRYEVNIFFREDYGKFEKDFIEFSNTDKDINAERLDNKLAFEFEGGHLLLYEFYYDTIHNLEYPKVIKGKLKFKLKKLL